MKVVIVHDWLIGGGAEKVVLKLHKLFPDAPIYTSYATKEWRKKLDNQVITGYLQHWPFRKLRKYIPFLRARWFKSLKLDDYDLIISSKGNGEANYIRKSPGTIHICYCHSPTHFYWRKYHQYLKHPGFGIFNPLARFGLRLLVKPLRKMDYKAAQKVDKFIANSNPIKREIKSSYNRDSIVIHPPVDIKRFKLSRPRQRMGFVVAGRQTPYKRFDIAVRACSELNLPLNVIGDGPENKKLRKLAGKSVKFITDADDQELVRLLQSSTALIFPQEEDFGIIAVEAMAAGTPVIAYRGGGALDYVIENKTGLFFDQQTVENLTQALKRFNNPRVSTSFNPSFIQKHAEQFSIEAFHINFKKFLKSIGFKND